MTMRNISLFVIIIIITANKFFVLVPPFRSLCINNAKHIAKRIKPTHLLYAMSQIGTSRLSLRND